MGSNEKPEFKKEEGNDEDEQVASRRNFLKKAGMAAIGAAALSVFPAEKADAHQASIIAEQASHLELKISKNEESIKILTPFLDDNDALVKQNKLLSLGVDEKSRKIEAAKADATALGIIGGYSVGAAAGVAGYLGKDEDGVGPMPLVGMIGGATGGGIMASMGADLVYGENTTSPMNETVRTLFETHDFNLTQEDVSKEIARLKQENEEIRKTMQDIHNKYMRGV